MTRVGPAGSRLVEPRRAAMILRVILDNGVIRTMDPSLPLARALAIAGERIAGGVGTHESRARLARSASTSAAAASLPGFTDAHVHFPTWALARSEVRLEGARLARGGASPGCARRCRRSRGRLAARPRLAERRLVAAGRADAGRRSTRSTGDVPVALLARDSHSLWLNSAALARADGDLEVAGGVVERDERGEPTGVLREESAWHFRDTTSRSPTTSGSTRCARGCRSPRRAA